MPKQIIVLLMLGLLASCGNSLNALKVGGKPSAENNILSEMIAILAEQKGIPVKRYISYGTSEQNLEALKTGALDIYIEYTGTALAFAGQSSLSNPDGVFVNVQSHYRSMGLTWGKRLGFSNGYGFAMRASKAKELAVSKISELVGSSGGMTVGVEGNFLRRPVDGFTPLADRYGMSFGKVRQVSIENRMSLYDGLLAEDMDVIEVLSNDSRITKDSLVVLEDDLGFFPAYEAAPLLRSEALTRFPALQEVLDLLDGKISAARIQALNKLVAESMLTPQEAARQALADMGLIAQEKSLKEGAVRVAVAPVNDGTEAMHRALDAVKAAFPRRHVHPVVSLDPLSQIENGMATFALVSAVDFFDPDSSGMAQTRPFEALGAVGRNRIHIIGLNPSTESLLDVRSLATGPVGSASYRAGRIFAAALPSIQLHAIEGGLNVDVARAAAADAMLILAPVGANTVKLTLPQGRLISVLSAKDEMDLARYPYLRRSRLPAGTYQGQSAPIETFSAQLVLAGSNTSPVTAVELSEALHSQVDVDSSIPISPALGPETPKLVGEVNPDFAVSLLNIATILFLFWLTWLYARPIRH